MRRSERAWAEQDEEAAWRLRGVEREQEQQAAQRYAGSQMAALRRISVLRHIEGEYGLSPEEQAELDILVAAESDREENGPGWTRDETIARRVAWNARVRACGARSVTPDLLARLEREAGHGLRELQDAIRYYSL